VAGDLGAPRLGLPETDWRDLAERADAIVHNGALVNHVAPYQSLRPVNVGGTHEVLRLAGEGRLKAVHYVSSMSAVCPDRARQLEVIPEELALGGNPDSFQTGYPRSKWAGERLVELARERGVPCLVHRASGVIGHTRDGFCNPGDYVFRLLGACVQMGAFPDVEMDFNLIPVDYAAAAVTAAVLAPQRCPPVLHVVNPAPLSLSELLSLSGEVVGPLRRVTYGDWWRLLHDHCARSGAQNPLFPYLYTFPEPGAVASAAAPVAGPRFECARTVEFLSTIGSSAPSGPAFISRSVEYLASTGFFG
jgi:thioester reductase-like protein